MKYNKYEFKIKKIRDIYIYKLVQMMKQFFQIIAMTVTHFFFFDICTYETQLVKILNYFRIYDKIYQEEFI